MILGAKARIEKADWQGVHNAHYNRIEQYTTKVNQVSHLTKEVTNKNLNNLALWQQAKTAYAQLINDHSNYEIAETLNELPKLWDRKDLAATSIR